MAQRIFVTGMGIITAIGNNAAETFHALSLEKSGLGTLKHIDSIHKPTILVAEVAATNAELAAMLGLESDFGYTRSTLLAMVAAKQAVDDAGRKAEPLSTGLISANTVGGMDKSEIYYYDYLKNQQPNCYIETHDCADSTEKVADFLGIKGFVSTISTACSSAANAILLGARLIQNGTLKQALVGGTECLTKFHINGFNSLKILDPNPCKPFDKNRAGINLGEGAGFLMLESEETITDKSKIIAELTGWGNACEAFHQTASSPDGNGAYLAMQQALKMSGLNPSDIVYINAHGTGTDNNDVSEGMAVQRLFEGHIPFVSSTKPFTGHTTSAAGVVESIITLLGQQHSVIFKNLNFSEKIDELVFEPVKETLTNIDQPHVMMNSFGFGGNDTSLIFSKFVNK